MTFYDLNLKIKGYSESEKMQREMFRRVAMFSYYGGAGVMGGKKATPFEKMWPSEYANETDSVKSIEAKRDGFKALIDRVNQYEQQQNKT